MGWKERLESIGLLRRSLDFFDFTVRLEHDRDCFGDKIVPVRCFIIPENY